MNLSYLAAALAGSLVLSNSLIQILATEKMELVPEPKHTELYPYPKQDVDHFISSNLTDELSEYLIELYTSTPSCAMLSSDDVLALSNNVDQSGDVTYPATYYGTGTTLYDHDVTAMGVLTEYGPAFIEMRKTPSGNCIIEYRLPAGVKLDDFYIWDTPEWTIESLKRITNQILKLNTAA